VFVLPVCASVFKWYKSESYSDVVTWNTPAKWKGKLSEVCPEFESGEEEWKIYVEPVVIGVPLVRRANSWFGRKDPTFDSSVREDE